MATDLLAKSAVSLLAKLADNGEPQGGENGKKTKPICIERA